MKDHDNVYPFPMPKIPSANVAPQRNPVGADGVGDGETAETLSAEDYNRMRAAIVFTHCWGVMTEAMLDEEEGDKAAPNMVAFDNAPNAWVGRQGYVRLFPDYPSSPVGRDRGGMAFYDIEEVMVWVGRTFPDIVEIVSDGVADVKENEVL